MPCPCHAGVLVVEAGREPPQQQVCSKAGSPSLLKMCAKRSPSLQINFLRVFVSKILLGGEDSGVWWRSYRARTHDLSNKACLPILRKNTAYII